MHEFLIAFTAELISGLILLGIDYLIKKHEENRLGQ